MTYAIIKVVLNHDLYIRKIGVSCSDEVKKLIYSHLNHPSYAENDYIANVFKNSHCKLHDLIDLIETNGYVLQHVSTGTKCKHQDTYVFKKVPTVAAATILE